MCLYFYLFLIHYVDHNLCICILRPVLRFSINSPLLLAKVPENKIEWYMSLDGNHDDFC